MNLKVRSAVATLAVLMTSVMGLTACVGKNQARTETPVVVVEGDDDGFSGTLVDPPLRPATVALKSTQGAQVDLARPAPDKVTVLYFGFTKCDDVCPTTMADLAAARRSLPPSLAEKVTVLFVTVDPRRDTPPVLERWLGQFDQTFVGLRGPTDLVHAAERSLYLPESGSQSPSAHPDTDGADHASKDGFTYKVDHSGLVYVFGPGDRLLLYSGGTTPAEYTEDLTRLLTT